MIPVRRQPSGAREAETGVDAEAEAAAAEAETEAEAAEAEAAEAWGGAGDQRWWRRRWRSDAAAEAIEG